ncbi:MAG: sugar-transfer associated ATP-grasp domain-containing protein [Pseudomonadota bacterium]
MQISSLEEGSGPIVAKLKAVYSRLVWAIVLKNRGFGLPFQLISRTSNPRSRKRRAASRKAVRMRAHPLVRPLALLAMMVTWPLLVWRGVRGLSDEERAGRSRLYVAWLSLTANFSPSNLVDCGCLHRPVHSIDDVIEPLETIQLMVRLRSAMAGGETKWMEVINNKAKFAHFCAENDLPHPALYGSWDGTGERLRAVQAFGRPAPNGDIVLKPACSARGRGIELWSKQQGAELWSKDEGEALTFEQLEDRCRNAALRDGGAMLQERAICSPNLHLANPTQSPTVRVWMGTWPTGEHEAFGQYMNYPAHDGFVSHYVNGGSLLGVEESTGVLFAPKPAGYRYDSEAAQNIGRQLPHWEEGLVMLERAQSRVPAYSIILGWDIVFTVTGPVLLEANFAFPITPAYMINGTSADLTRLEDFYAAWIERLSL